MRPSPIIRGILKRSSYYNPDYTQSAALIRARRPYLVRNTATGIGIASFAIGVFVFTLKAVGQEQFDDVIVPSGPSSGLQAGSPGNVSVDRGQASSISKS